MKLLLIYYSSTSRKNKTNISNGPLPTLNMAAPKKCVKTLQSLALIQLSQFVADLTDWISNEIIALGSSIQCSSLGNEYRKGALNAFLDEYREMIMPVIAPSLLEEVIAQILDGIR